MIGIAFQRAPAGIKDLAIQVWTNSPFFHCGVVFADGSMFEASSRYGLRFIHATRFDVTEWEVITIPTTIEGTIAAFRFSEGELGCPYDWASMWWSQVMRKPREDPKAWYCSEFCAAVVNAAGYDLPLLPCAYNPGNLFRDVVSLLRRHPLHEQPVHCSSGPSF